MTDRLCPCGRPAYPGRTRCAACRSRQARERYNEGRWRGVSWEEALAGLAAVAVPPWWDTKPRSGR